MLNVGNEPGPSSAAGEQLGLHLAAGEGDVVVGGHHQQVQPPPVRLPPRERLDRGLSGGAAVEERDADALPACGVQKTLVASGPAFLFEPE